MTLCEPCATQAKRSPRGKAHEHLVKIGTCRLFKGQGARSFEEQDYQCLTCSAKFTQSTNRNDLAWTLWQG